MEKTLPGDVSTIYKVDSDIILVNTIYFVETNPVEVMLVAIKRWKCEEIKITVDELGNKIAETLASMLYYANPVEFIVGTSKIQPVYFQ